LCFYFYLSNATKCNASYAFGRNFNNTPYYYFQNENVITPNRTALTFNDIFDLTGWNTGDNIFIILDAYNNGCNSFNYIDVNLSLVYQPLFS